MMFRKSLAHLAIGIPAAVALLVATAPTSFADGIGDNLDITTSTTVVSSIGNLPTVTKSPTKSPLVVPVTSLSDSAVTDVESLTFSPAGSAGCKKCSNTSTADYKVTFDISLSTDPSQVYTLSDTAIFEADYSNDTDSVMWSGATDTAFCTPYTDDGHTTKDCDVLSTTLSNGDVLDLVLNDAADWDIKSNIGLELTPPSPSVPEPPSVVLMLAGLLGVAVARRLRYGRRLTNQP